MMKRRNSRPGRRLDARPLGGGGSLPLPAIPDTRQPHYQENETGLLAPSHSELGGGPVLFGRDIVPERSARHLRPSRPDPMHSEATMRAAIHSMQTWETFGMRLVVN